MSHHVSDQDESTHQPEGEILEESTCPPLNAVERTELVCIKAAFLAQHQSISTLGASVGVICAALCTHSWFRGCLLRPCPTPGLIRLLRSHRSTVAQLRTSAHYSSPGRAHTLPLSATLCIRLNPVVTTLPRPPCCTVSSLCSVCIFYLVVFSPDLTYFHRT